MRDLLGECHCAVNACGNPCLLTAPIGLSGQSGGQGEPGEKGSQGDRGFSGAAGSPGERGQQGVCCLRDGDLSSCVGQTVMFIHLYIYIYILHIYLYMCMGWADL